MFESNFPGSAENKVRAGATIRCEVDGITYRATVYRDDDATSPAERDEGFWPSLDPRAPGFIGENPERSFETQQADCEAVVTRWKAGKMVYCGIAVTATKAGVELIGDFDHALWGVDVNWPFGNNDYLRDVANELLDEARSTAEAELVRKIEAARNTLAALES